MSLLSQARGSVEDEPHILLYCRAPAVATARHDFICAADAASKVFAWMRLRRGGWPLLGFITHCYSIFVELAQFVDGVY